jgi:hypothetical protein
MQRLGDFGNFRTLCDNPIAVHGNLIIEREPLPKRFSAIFPEVVRVDDLVPLMSKHVPSNSKMRTVLSFLNPGFMGQGTYEGLGWSFHFTVVTEAGLVPNGLGNAPHEHGLSVEAVEASRKNSSNQRHARVNVNKVKN